jgi:putative ABC transport system permease protein
MIARALGWIVGADLARDIEGDLLEERRRRAGRSRVGAVLWFWRATLATAIVAAAVGVRHSFNTWWGGPIRPGGSRGEWRQAWRSLRRTRWYGLTAAGVIALSIAFATTIFAIVDGVLFKPLPYPGAERLFSAIENRNVVSGKSEMATLSPAQLDIWRQAIPDARFAAYIGLPMASFPLRSGTYADLLTRVMVGKGFFETLASPPLYGGFAPEDFTEPMGFGAVPFSRRVTPAIVSYEVWQQWCGGDPSAIGRSIVDDHGSGIRVVGVLPRDFVGPWGFHADLLTPIPNDPTSHDRGSDILVRLPAGMTARRVADRLSVIDAALAPAWPVNPSLRGRTSPVEAVTLTPVRAVLTGATRATSWLVFAAAIALMALGCLNVAGLAAARVQDRWRDLVLRRALGAGPWDLVRLLATESAVVVVAGAVAGIAGAMPLLHVTLRLIANPVEFLKIPSVDWRVVAFAALAAAACVALITAVAARTLLRTSARTVLADGPTSSRRGRWAWSVVSGQVALAFLMAVGGALVAGSLVRVWSEDPGFDLARTASIHMNPFVFATGADIEALMADLGRLPGVAHAGGVAGGILGGMEGFGSDFDAPASVAPPPPGQVPGTSGVLVQCLRVTSGYLEAAGLALLDGRLPTEAEFASGAPVLVVSESLAREYWPGQRAVGQTLVSNKFLRRPARTFTVVGVVSDARYAALDRDPHGALYYPDVASGNPWLGNVLVKFSRNSPTSLAEVEAWMRRRCPGCPVYGHAKTLADLASASILPRTFHAWLFASFGLASLVVTGVGILGLVAMTSSRRTKEIGIRLALGATPGNVAGQILREQTAAVALGLLAGGLVAAWAVRFVQSYLYKVPVYDVPAWAAAVAALLLVAGAGAFVPALRASRVDPVEALRVE